MLVIALVLMIIGVILVASSAECCKINDTKSDTLVEWIAGIVWGTFLGLLALSCAYGVCAIVF